jgi:hypothetical protein
MMPALPARTAAPETQNPGRFFSEKNLHLPHTHRRQRWGDCFPEAETLCNWAEVGGGGCRVTASEKLHFYAP